ncbi:hypothetical protein SAMN05444161_1440 [Rhizobiales bacterium GAS191]|nr:hypothetical protein SAMN05444161_1440 [Rhizobiales bacterium GAS191]
MKHDSAGPPVHSRSSYSAKPAAPRQRLSPLVSRKPVVPAEVRALLGPSWIIEGEDPKRYEELLAQVGAAVQPTDLIDWLLLKDVVALTWEIQRTRRNRDSLMRMARHSAMQSILSSLMPNEGILMLGQETEVDQLALLWFNGDKKATKRVDELLARAGLSAADVTAQSLSTNALEFDRLDRQNERHEYRRDALLQQIERRRAGWAKQVKRASEDIVDAEYKESAPNALAARTNAEITEGQE